MDTSVIMGFMNALMDIKAKTRSFGSSDDKQGSSARTEMYQEYKAHRDETPGSNSYRYSVYQDLLAMHIPIIEIAG
jgi:DNA polymerase-1